MMHQDQELNRDLKVTLNFVKGIRSPEVAVGSCHHARTPVGRDEELANFSHQELVGPHLQSAGTHSSAYGPLRQRSSNRPQSSNQFRAAVEEDAP